MNEPPLKNYALTVQSAADTLSAFAGALAKFPEGARPSGFVMLNIEASASAVADSVDELMKAVAK